MRIHFNSPLLIVTLGIKDSMPATGKTVAQLAVFNALGNKEMAKLPRDQQLRMAYTVANATRAAVEVSENSCYYFIEILR